MSDGFQRRGHAEAGDVCLPGCDQDVSRVQRAVKQAGRRGRIEPGGHMGDETDRISRRRRTVLADGGVQRFAGHVLLGQVRDRVFDAGGDDARHRRRLHLDEAEPIQDGRQLRRLFRRQIDGEDLDGDQAIALGIVRAKHRPQDASTNLMEEPESTKRGWRNVGCAGRQRLG